MKKIFAFLCTICLFCGVSNADIIQNQKVKNTINILNAFGLRNLHGNEKFKDIKAIAIVPDVTKTAFVVSGAKGEGIFVAKNDDGEWSSPIFINYTAAGIGAQAGISSADTIILFKNSQAYARLFNGKDTISINAEATAGIGEGSGVTTDLPEISAFIVDRTKTSGAFIGVGIDLGRITTNRQQTNDYYERMYDYEDLYNNSPKMSKYTLKLHEIINKYFL
ncbi:lipid-binding SYLF domain-containing protein [Campylobacter curvus]|uniref:lipid-binding SYLF domain-containing protein n=1 Tax=Campylobacter curvus TaxID=200 RepID=UPI0014703F87|nr:lipid-binding SYLF domain-containing protein [Campylobacter curvus]